MKRQNKKLGISLVILGFCAFTFGMSRAGDVPDAPSDVYIDKGSNVLMVKKPNDIPRPFIIKGLSWSPATRAPMEGKSPAAFSSLWIVWTPPVPYGFFFNWDGRYPQGHEVLNYWLKNELSQHYSTDIPLMKQMNVNTIRIYHSLGSALENYNIVADEIGRVLDKCYENNIMAVMTVAMSKGDFDSEKYVKVVNAYKNHPAVLMWAIGNEWNLNNFYNNTWGLAEAASAVNQAARKIKGLDAHHPVCSILGDRVADFQTIFKACTNVDLWGLNVYRGASFGDLFEQWKQQWQAVSQLAKPFFFSEFGTDSFRTASYTLVNDRKADNCQGSQDQVTQAAFVLGLWNQIRQNLSAMSAGKLCLGGLIHEFNDELWKVGNDHAGLGGLVDYNNPPDNHSYDDYNNEGFVIPGGHPDNVANEEHFGLVDADRRPKQAFNPLKDYYASLRINSPPRVESIIPPSGQSNPGQKVIFNTTYSDADGWQDIHNSRLLINTMADGKRCFYGYYSQNLNRLYLRNDANTGWQGSCSPAANKTIENSYCKLDCSQSSVLGTGSNLTVKWSISFKPAFAGTKNTYLYVADKSGAASGWGKKGSWTVKAQ